MEISRCQCGRRKSKWVNVCHKCHRERMDKLRAEAQAIVDTKKCPDCGSALVRNSALPGWWQCVQYGRWKETHGDINKPNCGFQCFTE